MQSATSRAGWRLHSLIAALEPRRFLRFAVVGGLTTGIDLILFVLLRERAGLPILLANTISYSTGIIVNFTLNRRWTYADAERRPIAGQFLRFCVISLTALLLNNLLVVVLDSTLAGMITVSGVRSAISKMAATAGSMTWNYLLNRRFTFGK